MNQQVEDIKVIREMMEKSVKFQSFNGLSIVIAGIIAVIGAVFAYFYLLGDPSLSNYNHAQELTVLFADAMVVLGISGVVITFFCWQKAKQNHQSLFNTTTKRAAYNLLVPLAAGGIFALIFLLRGNMEIVISSTLLFYGLGLVNASKYMFPEIHYLGIIEIVLGLIAAVLTHYGLLAWTLGFGFFNILFGVIMYIKYEVRDKKQKK
ncbi:MAG: hypothetical protein LBV75_09805 [Paludibacter sp.]|jgi:uncharacterized membrane protein HdeD (DUF308 family)|nr:hypothetical protein [Paludibacter sp.]